MADFARIQNSKYSPSTHRLFYVHLELTSELIEGLSSENFRDALLYSQREGNDTIRMYMMSNDRADDINVLGEEGASHVSWFRRNENSHSRFLV